MLIESFNYELRVKHTTILDCDNLFPQIRIEKLVRENKVNDIDNDIELLFDTFIKEKIKTKEIAIQALENITKNTSLSIYFPNEEIFYDYQARSRWEHIFKNEHKMFLYFSFPNKSIENLDELFLLEKDDYYINSDLYNENFEIEVFSEILLPLLEKSKHIECQSLFVQFNALVLDNKLKHSNITTKTHKI